MKDKLFNIMLVLLIVYLTLQFFAPKPQDTSTLSNIVSLHTQKSYTIPASVKVEVKNDTALSFSFDTCDDFVVKKDSQKISPSECREVEVASWETYVLDLSNDFFSFDQEWIYYAELNYWETEVKSHFSVKNRGIIGRIFIFFFYAPIYNLMAFLLEISNYSLGWAIILITIIIRGVLLVPQHKMMMAQWRMQQIQPKIKEIQEKYKWNHQMLGMELMKLYKEEWVSPLGSCGMLLIQMPILIVIYHVILGIQDPSNTYYLYSFMGNYHMEEIQPIFYGVDLFGTWGLNWLILAITIWVLQWTQIKLSLYFKEKTTPSQKGKVVLEKKKDATDYSSLMPDPDMLNKFMLWGMPIMIAVVTYTFFAWLGLYWWVGTLFMILQQLFINKILKK